MAGRRRLIRIGFAVCSLLVALWIVGMIAAIRAARKTQHEAQAFLQDFVNLPLGTSSFQDVRRFVDKYHDRLWVGDLIYGHSLNLPSPSSLPQGCVADKCDYTFAFKNTWLSRLRLAPFTDFAAEIKVRNGQAAMRIVDYVCKRGDSGFIASVVDDSTGELRGGFPASRNIQKTIIILTSESTTAQRKQAYAFNLVCLSKIGGCKDSFELLPGPWRNENAFNK